jgi:hypothetical protein
MSVPCCPLGSYEGDEASCSSTKTRRARKEHACCECIIPILPGARYEHVSGVWDGDPSSFKTCSSCVEIRDHFACGNGYVFGMLWDDLHENFIPEMKAGGPCMEGLSPAAKQRLFNARLEWLETDDGREWTEEKLARVTERNDGR